MTPRPTLVALVTVLLALGASGCGEKEEPPTTGPVVAQTTGQTTTPGGNGGNGGGGGQQATASGQAIATVKLFLAQPNDPSVCDELITPAFLKKSYGNRQGCVAARKPAALADRITILGHEPGPGGSVVVTVKPNGGVFDGQTLKATVVKSGNAWKIDEIIGDAKVGP